MLETLNIRNIAVIDSAEVSFKRGLNIISGETGAGKSIVIEAIGLLLGGRASSDLIRTGCDEALVEGLFDTSDIPWIRARLERLGFSSENSQLLIKRTVSRNGRHRIFVNGELATLAILQDLCDGLVDLCGQHEHQSLLRSSVQLDLLDRYGGLAEQVQNFSAALSHYRSLQREFQALQDADAEQTKKADYLRFQIKELRDAQLEAGEEERLHTEKQLLQSAEHRVQTAEAVRQFLEEEEGVLAGLQAALSKIRALVQLDSRTTGVREGLERALAETEECGLALNRYLSSADINPERMQVVLDRLALLADLKRKYGSNSAEMLRTLNDLETQSQQFSQLGERLKEVGAALEQARSDIQAQAAKLSKARQGVAQLLSKSVTAELHDLKMEGARFTIELAAREDMTSWTAAGADSIQFLVQTNRGDSAKPLGKIASGGELSRLMLAVRRVIADRGGIGVYLFDEIDAGIGGQTAFQVGKKLKSVAEYNQVICITHLPQIASFANHHLSVRKTANKKTTLTAVVELTQKERKEELARMLGGPELTKKSMENAAELLELAR